MNRPSPSGTESPSARRPAFNVEALEKRQLLANAAAAAPDAMYEAIHGGGCPCVNCAAAAARPALTVEAGAQRSLSAGATAGARPQATVSLNVDFTTNAGLAPGGFLADTGLPYGARGNGQTYGWNDSHTADAVDRNHPLSPAQQYDNSIRLAPGDSWAAKVPNGTYQVRLLVGDPGKLTGPVTVRAEGATIVSGATKKTKPWLDGIATVRVTDGGLTLTNAGANAAPLSFVTIRSVALDGPGTPPAGLNPKVAWSDDGAFDSRAPRVEAGTLQLGAKLYQFGGYSAGNLDVTDSVEVLDLRTGKWRRLADIPEGAAESHAGIATDGARYIYWAAGQLGGGDGARGTNTVWRYDLLADTWSPYINLPEVRFAGSLSYFNGVLYFAGGDDASRFRAQDEHWALNTRSKRPRWVERAPMPAANDHHSAVVIDGIIYTIGGETNHGTTYDQHDNVFAYNPWTDTWTRKADLPTPSSHFEGGTHVIGGTKILALGGRIDIDRGEFTDEVRVYDTLEDKWTVLDDSKLPDARLGLSSAVYGGRVYLTNGYSPELGLTTKSYWGTLSGF